MNDDLKRLLESLGINWVWWQWRWIRFRDRIAHALSPDNNFFRYIRTKHKICRCGALATSHQKRCEVCGRSLPTASAWLIYRLFGLVAPRMAPATGLLSALIFVAFGLTIMQGGWESLLNPTGELLFNMGALYSPAVIAGEWWRLVTCLFLHVGIIHLGFNAMALLNISTLLEEEIGSARYFCVYLLSGIGGSIASAFLRPYPVVSAGASGALFGLIGFSIVYFHRLRSARGREVREFMARWAIYGFVFGLFIGADNLAHLGGLLAGMALGALTEQRRDSRMKREPIWRILTALLGLALVLAFVMAIGSVIG
jgi:rhomboid protease GluP